MTEKPSICHGAGTEQLLTPSFQLCSVGRASPAVQPLLCTAVLQTAEEELLERMECAGLKQCLILDKATQSIAPSQERPQFGPQSGSQEAMALQSRGVPGVTGGSPFVTFCFTSPGEKPRQHQWHRAGAEILIGGD